MPGSVEPAGVYDWRERGGDAGGRDTLAYGVTTNHVLGLELVLPDGSVVTTGGAEQDLPGYDLVGLMTGSGGDDGPGDQGGAAADAAAGAGQDHAGDFRISAADAGNAVGEITARGRLPPVAVEMLDGVMLRMVEEATHAGYPLDAGGGAAD
jgi:glycolate oxidase